MPIRKRPAAIVLPSSAYFNSVVAESPMRWLHVRGQNGLMSNSSLASDMEVQMVSVGRNFLNLEARENA